MQVLIGDRGPTGAYLSTEVRKTFFESVHLTIGICVYLQLCLLTRTAVQTRQYYRHG